DDPRKVCPTGWHIPNKTEWDELIATVNTSTGEFNNSALALKSAGSNVVGNGPWPEPNFPEMMSTNSSGFSSLPSQGAWLNLYDFDPQMSEYWVSGINENNFPYAVQLYANLETAAYYPYDESGYWTNSYIITQSIRCINDTLSSGLVSIPGCMDASACNYDAAANAEDGSCRTVGSPCNDTFGDTHDDVWTADCICAGTLITADPASCGAPLVHNPDLTYGTMTDQEGTTYKTIVIGTQEWMAENLATSSYRNGDPIPSSFTNTMTGECSVYMDDEANLCPHGRLYNWYAVTDDRHVCPTGWHEPSLEEWNTMVAAANPGLEIPDPSYIEGASSALSSAPTGLIGGYWGGGGTNTSGLSLLPSGLWFSDGFYDNLGYLYFGWLTNNVDDFSAYGTFVGDSFTGSNPITKEYGGTVRCVRD
ncbi:MAG: FISUMP domain-containing protein, partial [Flavobacteriales bacterium]